MDEICEFENIVENEKVESQRNKISGDKKLYLFLPICSFCEPERQGMSLCSEDVGMPGFG